MRIGESYGKLSVHRGAQRGSTAKPAASYNVTYSTQFIFPFHTNASYRNIVRSALSHPNLYPLPRNEEILLNLYLHDKREKFIFFLYLQCKWELRCVTLLMLILEYGLLYPDTANISAINYYYYFLDSATLVIKILAGA